MRNSIVFVALAFLTAACQPTYEEQVAKLAASLKEKRIGSSGDYWLVKRNFFDQDERVALVFGFTGDEDFCLEVAELYMRKHPLDKYKCHPAN